MGRKQKYNITMEAKFEPLELMDIPGVIAACQDKWTNQTLTRVNNSVVRLAVIEGEFHWHKHDLEDEFFFVLEGVLLIDLEDRTVELKPLQGLTVPRGAVHRTRAMERTAILLVEAATVRPTGD